MSNPILDMITEQTIPVNPSSDIQRGGTGAPISNDGGAVVYVQANQTPDTLPNAAPGTGTTVPNADVRFSYGTQPFSNDRVAGVIHHSVAIPGQAAQSDPPTPEPPRGVTINNDRQVSFVPAPVEVLHQYHEQAAREQAQSRTAPANRIPPVSNTYPPDQIPPPIPPGGHQTLNFSGDTYLARSAGLLDNNSSIASHPSPHGVMNVNTDKSIGGGGDPTRAPRSDEVSFGSSAVMNAGNSDVRADDDTQFIPKRTS